MTVIESFPRFIYENCYFMVDDGLQHFVDFEELIKYYGWMPLKKRDTSRAFITGMVYVIV